MLGTKDLQMVDGDCHGLTQVEILGDYVAASNTKTKVKKNQNKQCKKGFERRRKNKTIKKWEVQDIYTKKVLLGFGLEIPTVLNIA